MKANPEIFHHRTFPIIVEAYVTRRQDINGIKNNPDLQWRACLHHARGVEWQWCHTEQEAIEWIESWTRKLKSVLNP